MLLPNGSAVCLISLMFNTYYADMVEEGLEPVMSEQTYRALYSLLAVIAIPAALASPWVYQKFGVVTSCCKFMSLAFVITSRYPFVM